LLRSTPKLLFIRPADGNETSGAYHALLSQSHRSTVLALSRQNLPQLAGSSTEGVLHGAYVLQKESGDKPDVIITGTGSEVAICVDAAKHAALAGKSVRVVSFPSWSLFEEQSQEYQYVPTRSSTTFSITFGERLEADAAMCTCQD
jgi:transketolase